MKKENFSEALGGIDLKYVDEAEAYRRPRARKRHYLSKALAAAACLALAMYAVARFAAENSPAVPTVDPNLPVLDIAPSHNHSRRVEKNCLGSLGALIN